MPTIDSALTIFFTTSIFAIVAWAFRLEGRVNVNEKLTEQRQVDLKELINVKMDALDSRLERIEKTLNGHLVKD